MDHRRLDGENITQEQQHRPVREGPDRRIDYEVDDRPARFLPIGQKPHTLHTRVHAWAEGGKAREGR